MTDKVCVTIDEYIASFPEPVKKLLTQMRETIREAAPEAVEKISYRMPTFYQKQNLVHFAAMKHHIGFYPGAEAVVVFAPRLTEYVTSKGAIQFPLSKPLPLDIVAEITRWRVNAVKQ
ncbi:hypothetical protein FACS189485_00770 [Spirochaetia bacterium]|nr:hypothetical protein FACS189485_00770 [Spirochaetia bacterium]